MSHFAPLPLQAVTITQLADEAALTQTDQSTARPVYGLSQCLDPEKQNSDMVPTRENAAQAGFEPASAKATAGRLVALRINGLKSLLHGRSGSVAGAIAARWLRLESADGTPARRPSRGRNLAGGRPIQHGSLRRQATARRRTCRGTAIRSRPSIQHPGVDVPEARR